LDLSEFFYLASNNHSELRVLGVISIDTHRFCFFTAPIISGIKLD
jgi:hypothetical protein